MDHQTYEFVPSNTNPTQPMIGQLAVTPTWGLVLHMIYVGLFKNSNSFVIIRAYCVREVREGASP